MLHMCYWQRHTTATVSPVLNVFLLMLPHQPMHPLQPQALPGVSVPLQLLRLADLPPVEMHTSHPRAHTCLLSCLPLQGGSMSCA